MSFTSFTFLSLSLAEAHLKVWKIHGKDQIEGNGCYNRSYFWVLTLVFLQRKWDCQGPFFMPKKTNYFDNDFIMRNVQNATEFFVLFWREQFLVERVGTL